MFTIFDDVLGVIWRGFRVLVSAGGCSAGNTDHHCIYLAVYQPFQPFRVPKPRPLLEKDPSELGEELQKRGLRC